MKYHGPSIEDFGKVERQVHNLTSPPNTEEPPNGDQVGVATASGGGEGGAALGLLGIAAGIAAVVAGRNNSTVEPVTGPVEDEEEANKFE